MGRKWIVSEAAHTPAFWVIGLGMMLIALMAGGVMVYLWGRRGGTLLPIGSPFGSHDDDDEDEDYAVGGQVAEA